MNEIQRMFIERTNDELADTMMVDVISEAMTQKLEKTRDKGRGGWFGPHCSNKALKASLLEQVEKGDIVDVLNLAGMIFMREQLYGKSA